MTVAGVLGRADFAPSFNAKPTTKKKKKKKKKRKKWRGTETAKRRGERERESLYLKRDIKVERERGPHSERITDAYRSVA